MFWLFIDWFILFQQTCFAEHCLACVHALWLLAGRHRHKKKHGVPAAEAQRQKHGEYSYEGPICCRDETPSTFHEDFINRGYRQPVDFVDCLRGCFRWHNETMNVWTHGIGAVLALCRLVGQTLALWQMSIDADSDEEAAHIVRLYSPLVLFGLGVFLVCVTSATAHTFHTLSPRWHHICFMCDYGAIGFCFLTSAVGHLYYSGPGSSHPMASHFSHPVSYFAMTTLVNYVVFLGLCMLRLSVSGLVRTFLLPAFSLCPYVFIVSPFLVRYFYCELDSSCQFLQETSKSLHFTQLSLTFVGGTLLASRFPERLAPGVFDIVGHSHQLMHITVFWSAWIDWTAMQVDIDNRWMEIYSSRIQPQQLLTCGLPAVYTWLVLVSLLAIGKCLTRDGKWK